jgi:ribose transport system ATP-binding protein
LGDSIALEVRKVSKRYGGIQALNQVHLEVQEAEVCALLGENGAGKSTLVKILTGVEQMDEGEILLGGKLTHIEGPVSAKSHGIVAIYQEASLIEHLSIAQNLFLGHEPTRGVFGWKDDRALLAQSATYLKQFGITTDPARQVNELGLGEKRIIEILKAVSVNARILLLDEPTTGMSRAEIEILFKMMQDLKKRRVTMIYISHHLEEIFRVCDRVSVLRDGENAGVFDVATVDTPTLIRTMIGKDIKEEYPPRDPGREESLKGSDVLLEAENFLAEGMSEPISIQLRKGEILGVTGIIGAGKTELGSGLFGATKTISGSLKIQGREVHLKSPEDARQNGIAYIPEDRKNQGLFLILPVQDNLAVANIDNLSVANTFVLPRIKRARTLEIAKRLTVVPLDMSMQARNLSGGNQQKVVIGKWLLGDPSILIMDEPTRGIDVGAKSEIYRLVKALADSGKAVLFLSSEFEEIRRLSDRIMVLREGHLVAEMKPDEATSDKLLTIALGG